MSNGGPVVVPTLPAGTTFPVYYSRIDPVQNAAGQNTDDIQANAGLITISGTTTAPQTAGSATDIVTAYLFAYGSNGQAQYGSTTVAATVPITGSDLHQTDTKGNELYSWSATLDTTGLPTGIYALKSFISVTGINQSNGVTTVVQGIEDDTGTVTVQEYVPFTFVVHEDTELVSVVTSPETESTVAVPAVYGETLTTDGKYLVWNSGGDEYAEALQTGAVTDLTSTGAPLPGTLATTHAPTVVASAAGGYITYPSFTEAGLTFGGTPDFDFDPNNGAENPLPTVTDAAGTARILSGFGTSPTFAGYAVAASDDGNVVLTADYTGIQYTAYGASTGTASDAQAHVTYFNPAPTLAVDTYPVYGEFVFTANGDGTDVLTGTSNAIGQQVELDLGTPGAEAALATVRADGTWSALVTLAGYTGPNTLYVSVTSAAGTPTMISGAFDHIAPPVAPTLTGPTQPVDTALVTVTGTAPQGSTVTLYDAGGAVIGSGLAYGYQGQVGPSSFYIALNAPFTEGLHTITAKASFAGGISAASNPLTVDVDLTPPASRVLTLVVAGDDLVGLDEQKQPTTTVTGTLSVAPDAGDTVLVTDSYGQQVAATLGADGLGFSATIATPGSAGTVTAKVQDVAGNDSADATQAFAVTSVNAISRLGPTGSEHASLSQDGTLVALDTQAVYNYPGYTPQHVYVEDRSAGTTRDAAGGLTVSYQPSLSGDGTRLVLLGSDAASGTYLPPQAYAVDVASDTATLLSFTQAGATSASDGTAGDPAIAAGGGWAAFDTDGDDLGAGATGFRQVFEVNLDTLARRLVSVTAAPADGDSYNPSVSADGGTVLFQSDADFLVPDAAATAAQLQPGQTQLYAASFAADGTETVVLASSNAQGIAADRSVDAGVLSANGRYVAFSTSAGNLVPGVVGGTVEIYRKDLVTGAVILVSAATDGTPADGTCRVGGISDDGDTIAFTSEAQSLQLPETLQDEGGSDGFVKDVGTGVLRLASTPSLRSVQADVADAALSGDGRVAAFTADQNLDPDGGSGIRFYSSNVYVSTALPGTTPLAPQLSTAGGGTAAAQQVIAGTGEPGSTIALTDNGLPLGTPVTVLADGSWTDAITLPGPGANVIVATDTDDAGSTGRTASVTLDYEPSAPTVALAAFGAANLVNLAAVQGDTVRLSGTATGIAAGGLVALSFTEAGVTTPLGSASVQADGTWSLQVQTDLLTSIASTGTGSFDAVLTNASGFARATDPVTIDLTVPTVAIDPAGLTDSPLVSGTGLAGSAITLVDSFNVFNPATGITIPTVAALTTTVAPDGTWSVALAQPGDHGRDGTHSLVAIATAASGNTATSATVTETLDTTPPTLTVLGGVSVGGNRLLYSLSGRTDTTGRSITVLDNGAALATVTPAGTGFAVNATLAEGPNVITLQETDGAGNVGISAPFTVNVPYTPPQLTFDVVGTNDVLSAAQVAAGGIVTGTTDQVGGTVTIGAYYLGLTGYVTAPSATVTAVADAQGNWSAQLPPGLPGTQYVLRATVANAHVTTEADQYVTDDLIVPTVRYASILVNGATLAVPTGVMLGTTLDIRLTLNEQVDVDGSAPALVLNNGAVATYSGALDTATDTLDFTYKALTPVNDLLVTGLTLPAGTTINTAGGVNPLGAVTEDLRVGIFRPVVTGSTVAVNGSNKPQGFTLTALQPATITLALSGSVTVTGTPHLLLSDGEFASYAGPVGTPVTSLTFAYTPATGGIYDLHATGISLPAGANLVDASGTAPFGSLDQDLRVAVRPAVASITPSGTGEVDAPGSVRLTVAFTEAVSFFAAHPTALLLSDGGTATYVSGNGTNRMVFSYTPLPGQHTSDLHVTGLVNPPSDANEFQVSGSIDQDVHVQVGGSYAFETAMTGAATAPGAASFTVSFSKSVLNVTAAAFRFETGSPADARIASVTAVPGTNNTKWTVLTTTTTGGPVTLDFLGTGITDYAGDPTLTGTTTVLSLSAAAQHATVPGVDGPVAAIGDFNGDAQPDLLLPTVNGSVILYANGNGTYTNVADPAGVGSGTQTAILFNDFKTEILSSAVENNIGSPGYGEVSGQLFGFTAVGGAGYGYGTAIAGTTAHDLQGNPISEIAVGGSTRLIITHAADGSGYTPPGNDPYAGLTQYTQPLTAQPPGYNGPVQYYDNADVTIFVNGANGFAQHAQLQVHQLVQYLAFASVTDSPDGADLVIVGPGDPTFLAAVNSTVYPVGFGEEWITIAPGAASGSYIPATSDNPYSETDTYIPLDAFVSIDQYGGSAIGPAPLVGLGDVDATLEGTALHSDDVVATVQGSSVLTVAIDHKTYRNGDVTIGLTTEVQLDGYAQSLAMGDVDGDGNQEAVVVVSHDTGNDTLEIFSGKTGTLHLESSRPIDGTGAIQVNLVDINSDGRPDIILSGFTGAGAPSYETILSDRVGQASAFAAPRSIATARPGHAIDGYLSGATVFEDANGNGVLDTGEAAAVTAADGSYLLPDGGSGTIVVTGGTDASTGLAFTGTLQAPAGSSVVTPLTTLVQLLAADTGDSTADAEAAVATALGLPPGTDLLDLDPVAATTAGTPGGSAALAAAATVQDTADLLQAAGGTDALGTIAASIAASIAALPSGSTYDLTDAGVLQALAASAGLLGNVAATTASVAAASNALVLQQGAAGSDAATTEAAIAASSATAQGGAALALQMAGVDDSALAGIVAGYTGASLVQKVDQTEDAGPPCFCGGTLVRTARGEVAVEHLVIGDALPLEFAGTGQIRWIGHRRIDCRTHPRPAEIWPVRVQAGAFGPGLPGRDLWLSPGHAVFAEGVLIPVRHLVNGATVVQRQVDAVTYWHVEVERHDVLRAEGLPCETYLDIGNRDAFANAGTTIQLHPDFAPDETCEAVWEAASCAPLRCEGRAVDRVRRRLARQAARLDQVPAPLPAPLPALRARAWAPDLAALLSPDWYRAAYPDIGLAGADPVVHYAGHGRAEGRLPCDAADLLRGLGLFDSLTVAITMSDVVEAGLDPIEHFCRLGWRERRRPNPYFDTGWYLDANGLPPDTNPLLHYVLHGERQGLAPSVHFDPAWYRARHGVPDGQLALAHYLSRRRRQRISPVPSFDPAATEATHGRRFRDAYACNLVAAPAAPDRAAAKRRLALFIDDRLPARDRDAGSAALIDHMAGLTRLGFDVGFVPRDMEPGPAAEPLQAIGIRCFTAPDFASVEEVLRQRGSRAAVVYLHRVGNAALYGELARLHCPEAQLVYSVADLHFIRQARQAAVQGAAVQGIVRPNDRARELGAARMADSVITHSTFEAEVLRQLVPGLNVHTVPWSFQPAAPPPAFAGRRGLAFVGGYSHRPNADAAEYLVREVMPLVWQHDPAITCTLVGSDMPASVLDLAGPGVTVAGYVADLPALLGTVRLTVAPLRFGAGLKGKVLESLASGIPCVCSLVAAEGMSLPPLLADLACRDTASLAARILALHGDAALNERCSAAGLAFIADHFLPEHVDAKLLAAVIPRAGGEATEFRVRHGMQS